MTVKTQSQVLASAWIAAAFDAVDYWAEGELAHVQVEATGADEVRLGIHLDQNMSENAGIYLSRDAAARLSVLLAAASIAEVGS